jgi:hypothetical protein
MPIFVFVIIDQSNKRADPFLACKKKASKTVLLLPKLIVIDSFYNKVRQN